MTVLTAKHSVHRGVINRLNQTPGIGRKSYHAVYKVAPSRHWMLRIGNIEIRATSTLSGTLPAVVSADTGSPDKINVRSIGHMSMQIGQAIHQQRKRESGISKTSLPWTDA